MPCDVLTSVVAVVVRCGSRGVRAPVEVDRRIGCWSDPGSSRLDGHPAARAGRAVPTAAAYTSRAADRFGWTSRRLARLYRYLVYDITVFFYVIPYNISCHVCIPTNTPAAWTEYYLQYFFIIPLLHYYYYYRAWTIVARWYSSIRVEA